MNNDESRVARVSVPKEEEVARRAREALAALKLSASSREIRLERWGLGPSAGRLLRALLEQRALALPNEEGALRFVALRLRGNCLGRDGCRHICESISDKILELDLAQNSLGLRGVEILCDALASKQVERLDVSGNRCGPNGARKLCTIASLRHLKTSDNALRDEGFAAFGEAYFAQLAILDLRRNDAGPRGALALARGFAQNDTLTGLDLRGNLISLEGLWTLGDALKKRRPGRPDVHFYGLPVEPKPLYNRIFGPPRAAQLAAFEAMVASHCTSVSE